MLAYTTDKGEIEKKDKCGMCLHTLVLLSVVPSWDAVAQSALWSQLEQSSNAVRSETWKVTQLCRVSVVFFFPFTLDNEDNNSNLA